MIGGDDALPLAGMGAPVSFLMHVETIGPLGTPVARSPWTRVQLEPVADGDSVFTPRPIASNDVRGGMELRRPPGSMTIGEVEVQRRSRF